jgi:hypothetical protein
MHVIDVRVHARRHKQLRSVTVRIGIQPVVEYGIMAPPSELEETDLESKDSLFQFLAKITQDQPNGGMVEARCLEIYEELLLERLGVTRPVPDPVPVDLPPDV